MKKVINSEKAGTDVLMGDLYDVQEYVAFTVKTDYKKVDGLEDIFDDLDVRPANPEYLVTVLKHPDRERSYWFDLYCGFERYGNKFWLFGISYDNIKDKEDIKKYAMLMVQEETEIDWAKAIEVCIQE